MAERFRGSEGYYPSRILADKIYRNCENLTYCKDRGIRLSGPALGRPKKGDDRDKMQDYLDECEYVEVERRFSVHFCKLLRCCSPLGRYKEKWGLFSRY